MSDAAAWRESLLRFYDAHGPVVHAGWRHYYHLRIRKRLRKMVEPGARVLDIGCGTGDLLAALQPGVGVGVDLHEATVSAARRLHPTLRFHCQAGEDVHRLGDTFDVVILCQVLGEVYDVQALLRSVQRVCHARTRIILVHYNRLWQPVLRLMDALGLRRPGPEQNWLPAEEVRHLLHLASFETIRSFGLTLAPLYVPGVSSVVNRLAGNAPLLHLLGLNYVLVARSIEPGVLEARRGRSVSIIVPARNEAGHIRPLLARIPRMASKQEILFVEGGSCDDTWSVIHEAAGAYRGPFSIRCLQQPASGKGDAVRAGFAAARGDVLYILDADLSVPPEELPRFQEALESGRGEFINGSRMVYLMDAKAMRFLNLVANKFFGWVFTFLLSQPFRDTLCGTKVLTREDYERIVRNRGEFGDFDPFGDFDLLFGAARMNLKIIDVPVHYKARTYGQTNISRFRHGWLLARMCGVAARKLRFV